MNLAADASAVLSVLLDESDAPDYLAKLLLARQIWLSPVNWWEIQVRMRSLYGQTGEQMASQWMAQVGIVVEPLTAEQAVVALEAHSRYRGRPARLNMGDCFAYALAVTKKVPLLYKGGDFGFTDVLQP